MYQWIHIEQLPFDQNIRAFRFIIEWLIDLSVP